MPQEEKENRRATPGKSRTKRVAAVVLGAGLVCGVVLLAFGAIPLFSEPGAPQDPRRAPAQALEALSGLGYLDGYHPASKTTGVVVHVPDRVHPGYNFYTSSHAPMAILMDMDGNVLHTWRRDFQDDWPRQNPQHKQPRVIDNAPEHWRRRFWRRAHLFDNGDLLAIFEGLALVKLDKDSNVLWAYRGGFHHDLEVTDDGRIFVLSRRKNSRHASLPRHGVVIEDFIAVLGPDGEPIRSVSVLEALANSEYASLLERVPRKMDIFHTNTVEVLRGRLEDQSPAFKAGNLLVSIRNIDLIAVVDPEREKVVWALSGPWKMQHQPTVLDNGNMLLFDNRGNRGGSRVVEFQPFTRELAWAFEGNRENGFYSPLLGSNQRLPNGNTLITDSLNGKAFEVTPEKKTVWAFVNPERVGRRSELAAMICEMLRIDRDLDLLKDTP